MSIIWAQESDIRLKHNDSPAAAQDASAFAKRIEDEVLVRQVLEKIAHENRIRDVAIQLANGCARRVDHLYVGIGIAAHVGIQVHGNLVRRVNVVDKFTIAGTDVDDRVGRFHVPVEIPLA